MDNEPILEINEHGTKRWWLNSVYHREDGPAYERADGYKGWWLNGIRHREYGPAIEYSDGSKSWYFNGIRHRDDGPAVEWSDGETEWCLNGHGYPFDDWLEANNLISEEEKLMMKLTYG
jgi:hypothetical protein